MVRLLHFAEEHAPQQHVSVIEYYASLNTMPQAPRIARIGVRP